MAVKKWTAVVMTCKDRAAAEIYQTELLLRQSRGDINPSCIILTVEDPQTAVGSGGATLNALLVVAEHISCKQGYTGRDFLYDSCGRAFVSLPLTSSENGCLTNLTNLDTLLSTLSNQLAVDSPPGVWVCSTDMLLQIPPNTAPFAWGGGVDSLVISVPGSLHYSTQHGVYTINTQGFVDDIIYRGDEEQVKQCTTQTGHIPLVSGVVYLASHVAERLLGFHVAPHLACCTYMGIDSGSEPIELSIFFDLMLAMCQGISEEDYVSGDRSGKYGQASTSVKKPDIQNARRTIWKELHEFNIKAWLIEDGTHSYMDLSAACHMKHLLQCPVTNPRWQHSLNAQSYIKEGCTVAQGSVLINSILESDVLVSDGSVITNSHLPSGSTVGLDCLVQSIVTPQAAPLHVPDNTVLQCVSIKLPTLDSNKSVKVYVSLGVKDDIKLPVSEEGCTFNGRAWKDFLSLSGISENELWSEPTHVPKCIYTARIYPVFHTHKTIGVTDACWLQSVGQDPKTDHRMLQRWRHSWRMSLQDLISFSSMADEFKIRRELFFGVGQLRVRDVLENGRDVGLNDLYTSAVLEGYAADMLKTLDSVASESRSPHIAARTLANIADVLGAMARGQGGLRSGPAANKQWRRAFSHLETGAVREGVRCLERVRGSWEERPDLLVRAARHYEGAGQILIRHAVMTARQYISTSPCEPAPLDKWVVAECPARVDIAGGWSDTPPITYEHGGAVINAAVSIDSKKPIGAKVKRIEEPHIVLVLGEEDSGSRLILNQLNQLKDYNQPHAPGALLMAAFICADIISFPSEVGLEEQLTSRYGGGFVLHTWSRLPHGSGLGGSSILAGGIMAVLWTASGKHFTVDSLNHAVLHLEQMLTSGGGWQDQVGGLSPGIKIAHSPALLPLQVFTTYPDIDQQTVQDFSDRLVLVYTGRTRLARNLLQNVIRNWYARNPDIVETVNGLVTNAWNCVKAFEKGDLEAVGQCMGLYWEQKKHMAPGCEPSLVTHMMDALRPHIYGVSLAGAGGGGFMYVLTKEPNACDLVSSVLATVPGTSNITVHSADVDLTGMTLTVEGQGQVTMGIPS